MDKYLPMIIVVLLLLSLVTVAVYLLLKKNDTVVERSGRIELILYFDNLKIKGEITMTSLTMTTSRKFKLMPVDKLGQPSVVEPGTVTLQSSDEGLFEIVRDENDETAGKIIPKGVGVATFTYGADADLGDGVKPITGFTAVEVQHSEATGFGIEFSEQEDLPVTNG